MRSDNVLFDVVRLSILIPITSAKTLRPSHFKVLKIHRNHTTWLIVRQWITWRRQYEKLKGLELGKQCPKRPRSCHEHEPDGKPPHSLRQRTVLLVAHDVGAAAHCHYEKEDDGSDEPVPHG